MDMKKLLAVILAAVLALTLAGCGTDEDAGKESKGPADAAVTPVPETPAPDISAETAPAVTEATAAEEIPVTAGDLLGKWKLFYTDEALQEFRDMYAEYGFTAEEVDVFVDNMISSEIYYDFVLDDTVVYTIKSDDEEILSGFVYKYEFIPATDTAPATLMLTCTIDWAEYDAPEMGIEVSTSEYTLSLKNGILYVTQDDYVNTWKRVTE